MLRVDSHHGAQCHLEVRAAWANHRKYYFYSMDVIWLTASNCFARDLGGLVLRLHFTWVWSCGPAVKPQTDAAPYLPLFCILGVKNNFPLCKITRYDFSIHSVLWCWCFVLSAVTVISFLLLSRLFLINWHFFCRYIFTNLKIAFLNSFLSV